LHKDSPSRSGSVKKIAIVGLPNTGKSQIFNNLTGKYALVANDPFLMDYLAREHGEEKVAQLAEQVNKIRRQFSGHFGHVLNKMLKKEEQSDFLQELPAIRLPNPKAVIVKTYYRLWWFIKEAVPVF